MLAFDSLLFRSLATISLLIAIVAALFFAEAIFLPVALALLIALVLHLPMVAAQRAGLPQTLSVILLISALGALTGLIAFLLFGPLREAVTSYPDLAGELKRKLLSLRQSFRAAEEAGDAISRVADDVKEIVKDPAVQEVVVKDPNFVATAANSVAEVVTGIVLTLTIAGFILATRRPFLTLATMPFKSTASKLHAARIWKAVEREVSYYYLVATTINVGLGIAVGLVLWGLGVPMPHVWGIAVALLNFIMFVGPAIGTISLLVTSILTFETPLEILAPPVAYLVINFIEANLVTPHFLGRRLKVAPLAIILSLVFWGWLWGFAGLIIAVPTLVILKAVADKTKALGSLRRFISPRASHSRPETPDPTPETVIHAPERSSP
ncbi:AI-2E family transporter [Oricola cellulosilytica]|uniref:AI-2E family transporter n=1 Tax=Oricola cellulosilytica TaxID=1429082 RepID=A0A4R0PEA6_9HYPH|nr:AI-2E family transporter [Oricola cellulosilytica]TCD15093.1 AI-2E family transporter [Oricola cellulosilytica]